MKTKIALIQINLSPYRIPLFEKIANMPDIDFTLLLMAPDKPSYPTWKYDFKKLPFQTIVVPGWRIIKSETQVCINPRVLVVLYKIKPDIIICCGFTVSTIFATIFNLFTGTPIIVWMEGTPVTEGMYHTSRIRSLLRQWIAHKTSGFINAGQLSREYIESLFPKGCNKPMKTSYNCIDTDKLSHDSEIFQSSGPAWEAFRRRFPLKNILFSGQLIERKGVKAMINVYQEVLEKYGERVGLIILGRGELKAEIEIIKQEKGLRDIFIAGFVEPEDYAKYFAVADVFILLSRYDCNPLVVFEALSCGLPLVCSSKAGNALDFIQDGVNGYIVDPDDIQGATERLLSILRCGGSIGGEKSRQIVQKANYRDSAQAFIELAKEIHVLDN